MKRAKYNHETKQMELKEITLLEFRVLLKKYNVNEDLIIVEWFYNASKGLVLVEKDGALDFENEKEFLKRNKLS